MTQSAAAMVDTGAEMTEWNRRSAGTTAAATIGLAAGPSTMLVFALGAIAPMLARDLAWTRGEIAFTATIVVLSIVLVSPLQGIVVDRFGARRVVLGSNLAFACGLLAMSALPANLPLFYAMHILLSVLAIGLWPVGYLKLVSGWFDRRLGLALGIANSGIGIGAAMMPWVATAVGGTNGWRTVYLTFALLALATLPVNFLLLKERSVRPAATDRVPASLRIGEMFRSAPAFRWLLAAYIFVGFVTTGMVISQIPMLVDSGLSPARAALIQSTFGLAVIAGRLIVGAALDYVRATSLMVIACAAAIVAMLLYIANGPEWSMFAAAALLGLMLGAEFDVAAYLVTRMFGQLAFGRAYGMIYAAFQLASAVGAPLIAVSQGRLASPAPALLVYIALVGIGALCFLKAGTLLGSKPGATAGDSLK